MGKKNTGALNKDTINFLNDSKIASESKSLEEIAKKYADADKNAVEFAENVRNGFIQLKDGQSYLEAYEAKLKSTSFSFKNLASSAMNGLKSLGATAINALGGMAISAVISLLITGAVKLADICIHAKEKIQETAQAARSNIDSLNSAFQDTKAKAESALQAYNKLASGMDLLSNKNISLSDDEYRDFISAGNELAELFPQLVQHYDANGNAILNLGDNAEKATEKINALVDAQKQQLASDIQEELPDVFAGLHQKAKEQNAENLFNISNSSFVGSIEQLQKIQSIIEKITGKKLDIQTSVDGNNFIDTYGALDLGEQLRVYQDVLSDKNYEALSGTTAQADKALSDIIRQYGSIQKAISALDTDSINREYQMQLQNIFTGLSSDDTYNTLDENTQHIVSSLISNLDYASVADEVAGSYDNDIIAYLQDNIIQPIADTLEDENTASTVQEAYKNLLSLNTDDALSSNIDKVRQYITTIANALNRDFGEVAAGLGYDLDAKTAKVSNAQKKITGTDSVQANNRYDAKNAEMNQYIATLSEKEIDLLLNIPEDTKISTKEELENYLNSISDSSTLSPITSSIEQISSLLEPQFSKLGEAYRNIFTEDGFTTENIDASMLEGLRETFAEMESVSGTAFDTDELESFFAVLTSGTSDIEKMQKAFDDLASSYLDSTGILENLSEANADVVKTQLEALGVSNAQDIVNASLMQSENALANAQEEVTRLKGEDYAASIDLENASTSELEALYNEANTCGLASGGLASLLAQKYNVNNLSIASAADCESLAQLYSWSQSTAAALRNLADVKRRIENGEYVPEEERKGKERLANTEVENAQSTPKISTPPTVKTPAINKGGGSASKSIFSETFDWIERRIKRLQSKFDKWIDRAETALTSNKIEKYYNRAAKQLENLMSANSKAYNRYIQKADDVKLSNKYKKKVQNGEISSETLKGKEGEKLAEKIKKYQEYWEKAQEYLDSYVEQAQKLANIPLDKAAAKIERFNKSIELIEAQIENVKVDNYKKANGLINSEKKKQEKILEANQDAQKTTEANLKKAKNNLSKDKYLNSDDGITAKEKEQIKKALKDGKEVNLSYFKEGSAGYKAAVKYNEALKKNAEATHEAKLSQEAFNKWQQEAANQKFDNIQTYYNAQIDQLDAKSSLIQKEIDQIEARGMTVTAHYYQEQIAAENEKLEKYRSGKKELEDQLKAAEKLGLKGTQVWYDMKEAISDMDEAIIQSSTDIAELNKSITALADESFKKMLAVNDSKSEVGDWAMGLMESKDSFDDENATFTNEGMARLYSYINSYKNSKENATNYGKLLEDLRSHYEQGILSFTDVFGNQRNYNSMDEFKDSIDGLYEDWREQISKTYTLESKSIDLMQEKLQKELSVMQELIDAKKAALSADKNLHDYQKSIRTATDNVAALEKQIISIQGDTSEEGIARIQKLQKELADAQEDLSEKEYEKYISDQQSMLDNLQQEYSDLITSEMKQIEHLLENALDIMTNMETSLGAEGTIAQYLIKYGYKNNDTTIPSADATDPAASSQADSATETPGKTNAFLTPSRAIGSPTSTVNFGSIPVPAAASIEASSSSNRLMAGESVSLQLSDKKSLKERALEYIRNKAGAPTKKKSEYSDVNKKIWGITDGKVLSTAKLKELAEIVGVAYDNAKSSGSLYKKLKAIGVQGFKHGGIGKLVKEQGEDGIAIVKNGEGFVSPEDVDKIGSLVGSVPVLDDISKNLLQLPSFDTSTAISNTNNNIEMQISLPGVQNYQEFATALQKDPRFEKFIKAISIDELSVHRNINRLDKNKIHF